jgi:hypothetical protein
MAATNRWSHGILKILKSELAKRDLTYRDLIDKLAHDGIKETETNIKNKMARGTFSAVFFVQCLRAIGAKSVLLSDDFFEEGKEKKK